MGLAAYGSPSSSLSNTLSQIIYHHDDGIRFRVDPTYIHYGSHTFSDRFTDRLPELLGVRPRLAHEPIDQWHVDVAFAIQDILEKSMCRLVGWATNNTGLRNVAVGGGIAHNVKMNSKIFAMHETAHVFAHPLCSDSGAAAGAALAECYRTTGAIPQQISSVALGPHETEEQIRSTLKRAQIHYNRPLDLEVTVAEELIQGKIVAWHQGRMEAGPRALGQRSILALPRHDSTRHRVNAAVKHREGWRPFGLSMPFEDAQRYFEHWHESAFMTLTFQANKRLKSVASAGVHHDGSTRIHFVEAAGQPSFHRLLKLVGAAADAPILLNTSLNIKNEPIACSTEDTLRIFWSTGIDVLAIGPYIVKKVREP